MSDRRRAMWENLSPRMVGHIARHLRSAGDYLVLRATCRSWRSALPLRPRHLPTQLPFLICHPPSEQRFRFAFGLTAASAGNIRWLPETVQGLCVGSSYGWLILIPNSFLVYLFNPVTTEEIWLPRLFGAVPGGVKVPVDDTVNVGLDKAVLSSDPTLDRDFVVMFFRHDVPVRCRTCRLGDTSWTENTYVPLLDRRLPLAGVQYTSHEFDIVPYGERRMCAIFENKYWAVYEVNNGPPPRLTCTARGSLPSCIPRSDLPFYLVASAGEVLLATHCKEMTEEGNIVDSTRLFRFEPGNKKWPALADELDDIGDRILFLGTCCSVSVAAGDCSGIPGNAIYYVIREDRRVERETVQVLGVNVMSLENEVTTDVVDSRTPEAKPFKWRTQRTDVHWWMSPNLRSFHT
ncbi:hypothetical protein B296_00015639 [Ensete ventricosum]|uniref:KIB1-4 beta-propeller domain-containing protein n=1 Tax=Ensete ventricosum TaxID=4639 RepID=A0A426ZLY2_ENSVE|nr:hypothetical protein B296_00015639 [Ensete ventricosum]